MENFTNGEPKYGKNGKNMLAQQFMLVVDFLDNEIKCISRDNNTRIVFEEYLNIVNKSVLAFIAPSEDECECYRQDMLDSYNVIEQMADITANNLAIKIARETRIKELIDNFEFWPPHHTIGTYCNRAMAYVNGMRAAI